MKPPFLTTFLRVLAVTSSVSLLGGYVWFTQRRAQPETPTNVAVTEFEGFIDYGEPLSTTVQNIQGQPKTVILGTKSISRPLFSTKKVEEAKPTPDAVVWMMPGSKSFTGATTVVADQLQITPKKEDPKPASGNVVMPGSKISRVFTESAVSPPDKEPPKPLMPGSKRSGAVITPDAIDGLLQAAAREHRGMVMPGSKSAPVGIPLDLEWQTVVDVEPEGPEMLLGREWRPIVKLPSRIVKEPPVLQPVHQTEAAQEPAEVAPKKQTMMWGSKSGLITIPVSQEPAPAKP